MKQSRIERMLKEVRVNNYGKIAVLTIIAAVAAAIIGLTSMTSPELTAGQAVTPTVVISDFTYFPGQYVNKATGPSEHIQGF
jgi:hypothetical protein